MISVGLLLALSAAAVDADRALKCPETITVDQRLATAVEGWTAGNAPETPRLVGIRIFDGRPEQQVALVGDERTLSKTQTVSSWSFDRRREYWIECSYSQTAIVLTRPIPRTLASCSVTYNRAIRIAGLWAIQSLTCK